MYLINLVEMLRKWESHVRQCDAYDKSPAWLVDTNSGPCGIGRAMILNLLHLLEKGL